MSTVSTKSLDKLDLSGLHGTDALPSKEKTEKRKSLKEKHGKNVEGARQTVDGALTTESVDRKHKSKTHRSKGDKPRTNVSPRPRGEKSKRRTVAVGDTTRKEERPARSGPPQGGVSVFSASPPISPRDVLSSPRSDTTPQVPVIRRNETGVRDGTAPVSPRRGDFFTPRTPRGPANTASIIRSETFPTIAVHEQQSEHRALIKMAQNVEAVRNMPELKEATPEVLEETLNEQTAHYEKLSAKEKKLTHELKKIREELTDTASTIEAIKQEQKERRKSPYASPGRSGQTVWGVDTLDALDATLEELKLPADKQ